jgi:hypothetical protein
MALCSFPVLIRRLLLFPLNTKSGTVTILFLEDAGIFSVRQQVQTGSEAHQSPIRRVPGYSSRGGKTAGAEFTPTPSIHLHGVMLNHRDNVTA